MSEGQDIMQILSTFSNEWVYNGVFIVRYCRIIRFYVLSMKSSLWVHIEYKLASNAV